MKFRSREWRAVMAKGILMAACARFWGEESLYDLAVLDQTPLEAKVLSSQTTRGVRTEEISYVSEVWNDTPIVITGTLIAPEGATNLPAIIGCSGPLVTQRGYVSLTVNPGKAKLGSWYTVHPSPRHSGLYHSAVALIRAVSYLRSRPEVNPEAIGVTGGSIQGMMACYLAGGTPKSTPFPICPGLSVGVRALLVSRSRRPLSSTEPSDSDTR